EIPEDVRVVLEQAEVEARRVAVVDAAQISRLYQTAQLCDRRVEHEGVSRHQDPLLAVGQCDQGRRLCDTGGERLLDEHVLSMEQRVAGNGVVRVDRGCNHDCVDVCGQQVTVIGKETDAGVPGGDVVEPFGSQVGDGQELGLGDLVEVSYKVR